MKPFQYANRIILPTFVFLISLLLCSCEKEYYYQTLVIENNTDQNLYVHLYARSPFVGEEGMYNSRIDDPSKLADDKANFVIESKGTSDILVYTEDTESTPFDLINLVFDRIIIEIEGQTDPIIFKPGKAVGYPENIFDSGAMWDSEDSDYDVGWMLSYPNEHHYTTTNTFIIHGSQAE